MKAFRWGAVAGLAALLASGCGGGGSSNTQLPVFFAPTTAHGTLTAAATQNESAGITNNVGGSLVVADPTSDNVYLLGVNAASTASNLAGFSLNTVTGTLTLLAGSPFANSVPTRWLWPSTQTATFSTCRTRTTTLSPCRPSTARASLPSSIPRLSR